MVTKVIILDVDGPLVPGRSLWLPGRRSFTFDPIARDMLLALMQETGVKLVICSTWRKSGYEDCAGHFEKNGIDPKVYFHEDWRTKSFEDRENGITRGDEVLEWLSRHGEITHYAYIDDECYDLPGMVSVSFENGILWEDFEKARKLLDVELFYRRAIPPPDSSSEDRW